MEKFTAISWLLQIGTVFPLSFALKEYGPGIVFATAFLHGFLFGLLRSCR